ncbi:MAG: cyclic pyranopterin monophosphate synthase MoaC [Chitinivibrionales bacterium]|nr:cyclic pyranopterin monophosphate synthase MoaC [Chitinivibrionales bacterium]
MGLTHIDKEGKVRMVDVSPKAVVKRDATARGTIHLKRSTVQALKKGMLKKGDALACARIAGIMAAKRTSEIIPLCHNLVLDEVQVEFSVSSTAVTITGRAVCIGRTGVEMEALIAVSAAALTIYDMCKAIDKTMIISEIQLIEKNKEPIA